MSDHDTQTSSGSFEKQLIDRYLEEGLERFRSTHEELIEDLSSSRFEAGFKTAQHVMSGFIHAFTKTLIEVCKDGMFTIPFATELIWMVREDEVAGSANDRLMLCLITSINGEATGEEPFFMLYTNDILPFEQPDKDEPTTRPYGESDWKAFMASSMERRLKGIDEESLSLSSGYLSNVITALFLASINGFISVDNGSYAVNDDGEEAHFLVNVNNGPTSKAQMGLVFKYALAEEQFARQINRVGDQINRHPNFRQ